MNTFNKIFHYFHSLNNLICLESRLDEKEHYELFLEYLGNLKESFLKFVKENPDYTLIHDEDSDEYFNFFHDTSKYEGGLTESSFFNLAMTELVSKS